MRISNYAELIDEVADELSRPDLVGKVPGWIERAEEKIVQKVRDLKDVEVELTGQSTVADQDYIDLPAGCTEVRAIRIEISSVRAPDARRGEYRRVCRCRR